MAKSPVRIPKGYKKPLEAFRHDEGFLTLHACTGIGSYSSEGAPLKGILNLGPISEGNVLKRLELEFVGLEPQTSYFSG